MKKFFNFLAAIALVAMVAVGCEKSPYEVEEVVPGAGATVLFASTGSEDASTRVNLEESTDGSSTIIVSWRNKGADDVDKITVYDDSGDRVGDFTYGGTDGEKSGKFTGDADLYAGMSYTAVYPASTALTLTERNEEELAFAEQTQAEQIAVINDAVRMKAEFTCQEDVTPTLNFTHEMAIVTINITGQPNNKPQTLTLKNSASPSDVYTISYSADAVSANTDIRTYIAIHPQAAGSRTLNFELEYTNGLFWDFEADVTIAYEKGMRYSMGVDDSQTLYIATADELAAFRDDVNAGHTYEGRTVVLTDDITLSGEWTPIGTYQSPDLHSFKGTFDGGNHTISGLTITNATTNYQGLFGNISYGAIKNVKISQPNISSTEQYVGAVAGYLMVSPIENCAVIGGSVSGYSQVGGVVGDTWNDSPITSCYNTAAVTGVEWSETGGVVGAASSSVTSCYNTGKVVGGSRTGGVAGSASKLVTDCYNTGEIVGGSNYTGGVVGYLDVYSSYKEYNVTNCYNTGKVSGEDYVGGIIGQFSALLSSYIYSALYSVNHCYNIGDVAATGGYVGGIVGYLGVSRSEPLDMDYYSVVEATSCYNKGNVSGASYVGGIAGFSSTSARIIHLYYDPDSEFTATVKSCYNTGNVTATDRYAGGVVGYLEKDSDSRDTKSYLISCYNTGNVSSTQYSGGVVGISDSYDIDNCFYLAGSATVGTGFGTDVTTEITTVQGFNDLVGATDGLPSADFTVGNPEATRLPQLMGENIEWEDPILADLVISDLAGLIAFRNAVNAGTTYEGLTVLLTKNITLSGQWTPIGNASNTFKGTFDGDNNTISGLTITNATADYQGLFGFISTATIKNIKISNPQITSNKSNVGAVVGIAGSSTIENSAVIGGSIRGVGFVGGVVGQSSSSSITSCYNTATVNATSVSAGGIAGQAGYSSSVRTCYNTGSVTASTYAGGIAGQTRGSSSVTSCYNKGNVTITAISYCGGITAAADESSVTSCYNLGALTGYLHPTGAIVGQVSSASSRVSNSFFLTGKGSAAVGSYSSTASSSQVTNSSVVTSISLLNGKVGATNGLPSADFTKGANQTTQMPYLGIGGEGTGLTL